MNAIATLTPPSHVVTPDHVVNGRPATTARALVAAAAERLLQALAALPGEPHWLGCDLADSLSGWRLELRVRRAGELPEDLHPLAWEIVNALKGRPHRVTTSALVGILDRLGCRYHESTVKQTLASMVKAGVLSSSRVAPRGYRLLPPYAD